MYYLHPRKALTSRQTDVRYVETLMRQLLGGETPVFGKGDEPLLALAGFFPGDWPAVNFLTLLVYMWRRGSLELPPLAAAPVVDRNAVGGSSDGGVYFDFLRLESGVAREITRFYHKAKPNAVVVFLTGEKFEVAATTDVASRTLSIKKVDPHPHTPEGVATLKYSHGIVVKIPPSPREFHHFAGEVASLFKQAAGLSKLQKPKTRVEAREIYLLHGGVPVDGGVELDNDVYIYI